MFLRWFFATSVLLVVAAAFLNYLVDPVGIYSPGRANPVAFAETLRKSAHGLWWRDGSFDDRRVKAALARHSGEVSCVVIGSSHAMQIGSERQTRSLKTLCPEVLNLAVSGASLEDHLTLAWLAATHGARRIVLGADPWVLSFGKDPRWSAYSQDYDAARRAILGGGAGTDGGEDTAIGKFTNLISLAYTTRSLAVLWGGGIGDRFALRAAPALTQSVGGPDPVLLPDGSLVYSRTFVHAAAARAIPIGGEVYLTDGRIDTPQAIAAYSALIRWLKERGIEPVLLLTPYQQNVWLAAHSPTKDALVRSEAVFRKLAAEQHVRLIGSYDPVRAGCAPRQFYDFMHPKPDCLERLH